MRRTLKWVLRGSIVGMAMVGAMCVPGSVGAQRSLFGHTTDPKQIEMQIHMALPATERGLALLRTASTTQQINMAVDSLFDSYRYLRSAQESSEILQAHAKFPDPLVPIRNAKILEIRDLVRWCRERREELVARKPETTEQCIEGLGAAIRKLRILIATTD